MMIKKTILITYLTTADSFPVIASIIIILIKHGFPSNQHLTDGIKINVTLLSSRTILFQIRAQLYSQSFYSKREPYTMYHRCVVFTAGRRGRGTLLKFRQYIVKSYWDPDTFMFYKNMCSFYVYSFVDKGLIL